MTRFGILAILALVFPACTCGRRGGGPQIGGGSAVTVVDPDEVGRPAPDAEHEPNNSAKQAQELPPERGIEGSLTENDRDWYKVTIAAPPAAATPHVAPAPAPGPPAGAPAPAPATRPASAPAARPLPPVHILSATLSGVADADLVLEAWNESPARGGGTPKGERLVHIDNSGAGEGEVLKNLAVEKGVIYLLVREAKGRPTAGRYRLTFGLRPAEEGEEREPNWKASTASPLLLEGEAVGYLGWKTDNDWYRVEVEGLERSARLRVEFDGLDEVRASLSLRTAKGVLQERSGAPGEAIALANLAVTEGQKELFVVLRTQSTFNVESRYSLRVVSSVPPGATEAEPNDRADQATPVTPGTPIAGLLGDTHDRDLYSVKVTAPGVLRVEVIPPLSLDAALAVVGEAGKVLWEVDAGPAREPEVLPYVAVSPPRALFQVRAPKAASVSPVSPYQLRVTSLSEAGSVEREPNNDLSAATPWPAASEQMVGTIHPRGDVDWYRVAVVGDRLKLRAECPRLTLKLELFGADAAPKAAAQADAAGTARLDVPAEAGSELLLKVSEASGKLARPYRLLREKP
jgi:hypothetical protein